MTFKKHPLSAGERAWLVAATAPNFDPKVAMVALRDKLAPGFDTQAIDHRLYVEGRLTPVGRWHVNPDDPTFEAAEKAAVAVKEMIIEKPGIEQVTAVEVARPRRNF